MTTGAARTLLAAGALLLVVLGLEWMLGGQEAAIQPGLPRPHHVSVAPDVPRETADWAATVLARPLFSTSRRPAKLAESGHSTVASRMPRLAGIMITPQGRHAIFAAEGTGKPLVLGEGGTVNDIRIHAIEPGQVILVGGTVLKPAYDKLRVPTAPQPFQPGVPPNFQNPNFPNPNFQNPNFPQPGLPGQFPAPGMPAGFVPGQPPQQAGDAGDQDAVPPQPQIPQPFRPNLPASRRP